MNVAFLFNSDHPCLGDYYGPPVRDRILGAGVLQAANRQMRVSVGDILTFSSAASSETPTRSYLISLCRRVYTPKKLDLLFWDRLNDTHGEATVFCWLFQNMTARLARSLHAKIATDPVYIGAMDVEFSDPHHLRFFRNSLPEVCRLSNNLCSIFYAMGENEDPDRVVREGFEEHGFRVVYEDAGARRTIFDNYDTLDHFKRVEDFQRVFAALDGLSEDDASDLVMSLEEVHPRLFDAFASAALPWKGQKPKRI